MKNFIHVELSVHHTRGCSYTWSKPGCIDGVLLYFSFLAATRPEGRRQVEPGRTHRSAPPEGGATEVRMLLSFQRPLRLESRGDSSDEAPAAADKAPQAGSKV